MAQQPQVAWNTPEVVQKPKSGVGMIILTVLSGSGLLLCFTVLIGSGESLFGLASVLAFLISLLCIGILIRRVLREGATPPRRSDRIAIEIHILMMLSTACLGTLAMGTLHECLFYGRGVNLIIWLFFYTLLYLPLLILSIFSLLSVVRQCYYHHPKLLLRCFLRGIWVHCKRFGKEWLDGARFENEPIVKRAFTHQMIYIGVLVALGMFLLSINAFTNGGLTFFICLIGVPTFIGVSLWYLKKQNRYNQELVELLAHIDQVAIGNFSHQSDIAPDSMLYDTALRLSGITDSFQKSVDERIKSERMKIELVTNVSHDLKTPLTSIISYVELLKEEELSPEASDYVQILAQKSERLKNIVADLFDLAKVTSGEAEIKHEVLDMSKLTVQTLGDMEDAIEESGLQLKQNVQVPPIPILGDGKKLYRVLQNVVDNALKYSMKGTRVYLDLHTTKTEVALIVKNTSEHEMNFTAEEIMERFTRGDEARTTEGSGLGLSIARSFTEACGGAFMVFVDGDQFKVLITFPLTDEALPGTAHDKEEPPLIDAGGSAIETV